ncbi:MAG TPA: tetratricopeptide repeat protein, partial [Verrucomicrobiae bacterium]|nr:tetratricopeptide repeat protein [Verrucomicrobiae bacterium]
MNLLNHTQSFLRRMVSAIVLASVVASFAAPSLFADETNTASAPVAAPAAAPVAITAIRQQLALDRTTETNISVLTKEQLFEDYRKQVESARYLRTTGTPADAEPILLALLGEGKPELIQQDALLELANVVQAENDLPRAQAILSQFLNRWSTDVRAPEILLKQGQVFRQMGLNDLALAKFYSVMTAALALKNDQLKFYQHLVFQAQTEIAETHYQMGKFADAADFFGRLLKQSDPELNRPQVQFRLIRSLAATARPEDTAHEAQDFLAHYGDAPQQPEVRFYLAQAFKQMGRNSDALQQVLQLLQEQKTRTQDKPEVWAYWQQRAGNEIANQLYHEGDYPKALDVYLSLAQLDPSPAWQLPVFYQVGITYERLLQPAKAADTYNQILAREKDLGTNATPGLKEVLDMARWRVGFLQWQSNAQVASQSIAPITSADSSPPAPPET